MAVPERMSDRHTKSGEDMMEVLAHDIMRYETLLDQSDLSTSHYYRVMSCNQHLFYKQEMDCYSRRILWLEVGPSYNSS